MFFFFCIVFFLNNTRRLVSPLQRKILGYRIVIFGANELARLDVENIIFIYYIFDMEQLSHLPEGVLYDSSINIHFLLFVLSVNACTLKVLYIEVAHQHRVDGHA